MIAQCGGAKQVDLEKLPELLGDGQVQAPNAFTLDADF
jgi:hypothetical protein